MDIIDGTSIWSCTATSLTLAAGISVKKGIFNSSIMHSIGVICLVGLKNLLENF
jgi:hypothetical protein